MMTEAQKKMKKYTASIERKLNLPLKVKARVMTDFITSVSARREAGQTDEEIYAELGSPEKVAAELNEQMKEFACRKSPWRFAFLAMAVLAGLKLLTQTLPGYLLVHMTPGEAASVGIIGGADGPTAIFLTAPTWSHTVFWLLMLMAGIAGLVLLRRRRPKK